MLRMVPLPIFDGEALTERRAFPISRGAYVDPPVTEA